MVNETTKRIILIMTIIVMSIMVYLLHSPRFSLDSENKEIALGNKKKSIKSSTKALFQKRAKDKSEYKVSSKSEKKAPLPNLKKQRIKIGISLPLSGDGSIVGNAVKEAIYMAKSEIPDNTKFEYELIIEDNGFGKSTFINTHNLVEDKGVEALLSLYNKDAEIVAKISDKEKIPHITCSFGEGIVKNHKYTVNHFPTPKVEAKAFLDNLDNNNIRIFSIVASDVDYILEQVDAVKKQAKKENFTILTESIVKKGTSDFTNEIREIVMNQPEAVMVMLDSKELEVFAKDLNKTGEKIKYTSIDILQSFYNRSLVNGATFVMASDGDYKFKEDFRKRSVSAIPTCAPNLYDALKVLVVAFEGGDKRGKPKGSDLLENIKRISSFPSATGMDIKVSTDGTVVSPMVNMKIEKGVLEYQ